MDKMNVSQHLDSTLSLKASSWSTGEEDKEEEKNKNHILL